MALYVLSNAYRQPAKCIIRIGATYQEIPELYSSLVEVTVDSRRNEGAVANLKFRHRPTPLWETGVFATRQPLIIEADFGSRQEEVMRGYIQDTYVEPFNDVEHVTVVCQDESWPLQRTRVHRVWGGNGLISDQAIVTTILNKYGLKLDPASGPGSSCLILVQEGTDFQFLQQRAAANGYELLFSQDRVYFGPMRLDVQPQYSIMVHMGATAHCRHFSLHSVDPTTDEPSLYQAEGELDSPQYGHVLRVGEPVHVDALGECYGGVYYVDTVFHRFTPEGYRQSFNILRHFRDSYVHDVNVKPVSGVGGPLYDVL